MAAGWQTGRENKLAALLIVRCAITEEVGFFVFPIVVVYANKILAFVDNVKASSINAFPSIYI